MPSVISFKYSFLKVKIEVYKSVVTSLLYGAESWTLYQQVIQVDNFRMRCLRTICNLYWDQTNENPTEQGMTYLLYER